MASWNCSPSPSFSPSGFPSFERFVDSEMVASRAEPERNDKKEMDFQPPSLIDQSPVFFSSNGGNANPRKRGREPAPVAMGISMVPTPPPPQQLQHTVFSLQVPAQLQPSLLPPALMGMDQLQSAAAPSTVSTGLRLALDEQNQRQQPDSLIRALFTEEVAAQISQQKEEIEQFLLAQREQLRRALVERRQRHYRILLAAAEESIGKKLREKEVEIERAARQSAELEDRLGRLRAESMAWQAKAIAEQAAAASLHAQLQQASAAAAAAAAPSGVECCGESPAGDAESAYVDPVRSEVPERACRACLRRPASMVLIPCRHLCLCPACDSTSGGEGCPVCGCVRTGSVQVFLS